MRTKIGEIREAAVTIIARDGIRAASVAAIAAQAGVSTGYLYRYYSSKEALINDLLAINFEAINEKISVLLAEEKGLRYITVQLVRHIVSLAGTDTAKVRFLITLLNDFSIRIDPRMIKKIDSLAQQMLAVACREPGVRRPLSKTDLFIALVAMPMQYLAVKFNGVVEGSLTEGNFTDHVVESSLKLIYEHN